MSEQESIQQDKVSSVLDLSDEEIANLDPSQFEATTPVVQAEEEVEVPTEEHVSATTESTVDDDEGEEVVTPRQQDETPTSNEPVEETKTGDADYKAFYDQVTAQFKANGTNLQFKDPSEIISLMQMGANYNKKMAEFKEPRRYLKMLQDNGLLSEDKLSFLIDVHKKDPNAIAKLVKESGLEMYDLDSEEKANQYKTSTYAPTSSAVELEDVLAELQDAPTYARLVDMVGTKFDSVSRERVASTPSALRDLNNHMANGTFDKIMDIMQPQFQDETPVNPFDFWAGANFRLKIRNFEGYRNYDKSEFDKASELFNGDEVQLEETYGKLYTLSDFTDPLNYKSYAELKRKLVEVLGAEAAGTSHESESVEAPSRSVIGRTVEAAEPQRTVQSSYEADTSTSTGSDDDDDDSLSYFAKLAQS